MASVKMQTNLAATGKRNGNMKRLTMYVLGILLFIPSTAHALVDDTIEQIITWKKEEQQLTNEDALLQQDASSALDWYAFSLGRLGYADDFNAYIAVTEKYVADRYLLPEKLDAMKATEWHRISLALLAIGADPTNVDGINLIADGTYDRDKTASLGTQGINGWIWGLITLDSMRYIVPDDAATTRQDMIREILAAQLPDGGFSFYHDKADVDITAMALQALAPYANSFEQFTYTQHATNETVTKSVRTVVDEALAVLSTMQTENGDFGSYDATNAESTAQVLVALSMLQIDPLTDERFIKQGNTVIDGLMRYKQQDGGFIHASTYNPENPTSLPDQSNSMASEQSLYALVAYKRYSQQARALYDMRAPLSTEEQAQIDALEQQIEEANLQNRADVEALLAAYEDIAPADAMYIEHFDDVQHAVEELAIDYDTPNFSEEIGVTTNGAGTITALLDGGTQLEVTAEAIAQWLAKETFVTADYSDALRYLRYAKEQLPEAIAQIEAAVADIEALQAEVDALNEDILQHIYPISQVTLEDEDVVRAIQQRFQALPEAEQQQIINYEDLQQLDAHMDSLVRELWIKRALIALIIVGGAFTVYRIIQRKRRQEL